MTWQILTTMSSGYKPFFKDLHHFLPFFHFAFFGCPFLEKDGTSALRYPFLPVLLHVRTAVRKTLLKGVRAVEKVAVFAEQEKWRKGKGRERVML